MNLVERGWRKYYKWSSARFCRRLLEVRCDRPIVSFSFDDFPHTAAATGGDVLAELGIRATYFVSFGLAELSTSGGQAFTLDDVSRVVESGHELGCHTFGHELSHRVSSRLYERSIRRNEERLREVVPDCPWQVFAYPAGSATPRTKRIVQKRFLCGRGTAPGVNAGRTDINLLRANSLYSQQRPVSHHLALIQQSAAESGWLIFYTHDVQDEPSRFGCTADYLREIAQAAHASGATILPIGQAMAHILEAEAP